MGEACPPSPFPSSLRCTPMAPQGCHWTPQLTPPLSQTRLDCTRPPVFTFIMQTQQNPPHPTIAFALEVRGTHPHHSNNFPVKAPMRLTSASTCTATIFISRVLIWSGCVGTWVFCSLIVMATVLILRRHYSREARVLGAGVDLPWKKKEKKAAYMK